MKKTYLSRPPPNMNLIGEVCDSLGKDFLTSFVGNHWATGWLWSHMTSVKARDYKQSFVCLQMVEIQASAVCELGCGFIWKSENLILANFMVWVHILKAGFLFAMRFWVWNKINHVTLDKVWNKIHLNVKFNRLNEAP